MAQQTKTSGRQVALFLAFVFVLSAVSHFLYAEGYAFSWALDRQIEQGEPHH